MGHQGMTIKQKKNTRKQLVLHVPRWQNGRSTSMLLFDRDHECKE